MLLRYKRLVEASITQSLPFCFLDFLDGTPDPLHVLVSLGNTCPHFQSYHFFLFSGAFCGPLTLLGLLPPFCSTVDNL